MVIIVGLVEIKTPLDLGYCLLKTFVTLPFTMIYLHITYKLVHFLFNYNS